MSDAFVTSLNLVCHSYHRIKDLFQSPLLIHSLLLFFLRIIQYILLQKNPFISYGFSYSYYICIDIIVWNILLNVNG